MIDASERYTAESEYISRLPLADEMKYICNENPVSFTAICEKKSQGSEQNTYSFECNCSYVFGADKLSLYAPSVSLYGYSQEYSLKGAYQGIYRSFDQIGFTLTEANCRLRIDDTYSYNTLFILFTRKLEEENKRKLRAIDKNILN